VPLGMKNYTKNKHIEDDYVTYEIEKYIDYLNVYVSQILGHTYGGSSSKFIRICRITLYIYRISNTGSRIVGMEKYIKNQNIYSCVSGDHMCVLECIYISVFNEEYKKLNRDARHNSKIKTIL
jgi:hypothetical protein